MKALCLAAALALAPGTLAASSEPEAVDGEIVLTDSPFCEFFVVRTDSGLALLDWRAGMYVFSEGDHVRGPLHTPGVHEIELGTDARLTVRVEDWGLTADEARKIYYLRCKLDQPGPKMDITVQRR